MKMNKPKASIAGALMTLLVALPLNAFAHRDKGHGHGHGHRTGGIGEAHCNDGMVVVSPNTLFPPNHKLVTVDVAYMDNDGDGDSVTLATNAVSSNQDSPDGISLCGNQNEQGENQGCDQQGDSSDCASSSGPDWIIGPTPVTATDPNPAATTVQLRAERCGDEGSRIYTINVTCTDNSAREATSQSVDVMVTVPHDQGHD